MKSTEVRRLAQTLAAEVNDLTGALVNGRLQHTCGGDPAATVDCQACGVAEDKQFERLADR
jgi:hypothetical protein